MKHSVVAKVQISVFSFCIFSMNNVRSTSILPMLDIARQGREHDELKFRMKDEKC